MNNYKIPIVIGYCIFFLKMGNFSAFARPSCPKSPQGWRSWVSQKINQLEADRNFLNLKPTAAFLNRCEAPKPVSKCLAPLKRFADKVYDVHRPGRSLGMSLNDKDYLAASQKRGQSSIPKTLLEPRFLKKIDLISSPSDNKLPDIIAEIKKRLRTSEFSEIAVFPYTSQFLPSVDQAETHHRLAIVLENDDRFVFSQINFGTETGKPAQGISVISIDKRNSLAYFHDLYRIRTNSKLEVFNRLEVNRRLEDCSSCHKAVFIPIDPNPNFDFKKYGKELHHANSRMRTFRETPWAYKTQNHQEPSLGLIGGDTACAPSRWKKQNAMAVRCGACHNHKANTALTFPSGLDIQLPGRASLVKHFVSVSRNMPPWFHELPSEFSDWVLSCVTDDLYGTPKKRGRLFEYLAQESCFDGLDKFGN